MFFFPITRKSRNRLKAAYFLYKSCVDQARRVEFYRDACVPDTLTGRFDMIALHVGLVVTKCQSYGSEGEKLAQSIFDAMFVSLDQACREMGIGDLSVPRHIKRMMAAFKGRAIAFDNALCGANDDVLKETIIRNLYGGQAPSGEIVQAMLNYVRNLQSFIAQQNFEILMSGELNFSLQPEFPHESTQRDVA